MTEQAINQYLIELKNGICIFATVRNNVIRNQDEVVPLFRYVERIYEAIGLYIKAETMVFKLSKK